MIREYINFRKLKRYYKKHNITLFYHEDGMDYGLLDLGTSDIYIVVSVGDIVFKHYILRNEELDAIIRYYHGKSPEPYGEGILGMVQLSNNSNILPFNAGSTRVYGQKFSDKYVLSEDGDSIVKEGLQFIKVRSFKDRVWGIDYILLPDGAIKALYDTLMKGMTDID